MDTYRVKCVFKRALLSNTLNEMKEVLLDGYEEFCLAERRISVCDVLISAQSYEGLKRFDSVDHKLDAIRYMRLENHGLGLKEAKDIVEHELYERGMKKACGG
jgi:hypothetical protein